MAFTTTTDYTGFYQISGNSFSSDELEIYIDSIEPDVLRDLLGCDLYDLFIADLVGGVPQTQRFIDIYNSFCYDDGNTNGTQYKSKGIKEMLKGFVYYSYVSDSDFANIISGNIKNTFSNSERATGVEFGLRDRYNTSLLTYEAIQWFICDNSATYPEFNGMTKEFITWL